MTIEEIKNTPELVDYFLDESVMADSRKKLHKRMDEICNLAIKALEQEPCDVFDKYGNYKYPSDVELTEPNTATSMPCEDAISRQAVLSMQYRIDDSATLSTRDVVNVDDIEALPPVTPQLKTGHWIRWYEQNENEWYIENIPHCKCSECGEEYDTHSSQFIKYCSECGAKMVEPQGSEKLNKKPIETLSKEDLESLIGENGYN